MRIIIFLILLTASIGYAQTNDPCKAGIVQPTPAQPQPKPTPALPQRTAKLLFKTKFGDGISLGPVRNIVDFNAWQDIVGTDKKTGFSFPIKALQAYFTGFQWISYEKQTAATIHSSIETAIRKVPGPEGTMVNELMHNVLQKGIGATPVGKGHAQVPFLINRGHKSGDVKELYIRYWYKIQKNISESLKENVSSGNWKAIFEFKTGGYKDTYGGDYRITVGILKNKEGKIYWHTKGDNNANGPFPEVSYWRVVNYDIPVPVDTWFKHEVYWNRSTGADGRFWTAINGKVIADYKGPTMGDYKLPINRIFINSYSGGAPPIESHLTDLEIWSTFPWR
ncbi:MAG: hypothetical protein K2Q18_06085 [Bdellovibrionales bacterium]|nr:hypothetical protein [Bdellovibrionales bacterium]